MPEEKETEARPIVESTVKKEMVDPTEKDLFEDVFGIDKEKENAKQLLKKKQEEILAKKPKKELKENTVFNSEEKIEKPAEKVNEHEIQKIETEIEKLKNEKKPVQRKLREKKVKKEIEKYFYENKRDNASSAELEKIREVIVKKAKKAAMESPPIEGKEEDDIKEIGIHEEKLEPEQKMEREIEEEKETQIADKIGLKPELAFIEYPEKNAVFIGRKKSVFEKYGDEAALYLGQIEEAGLHQGKKVLLDSLNPHVVFICGSRGSGKSYIMGIIAEELALNNKDVGVIVIDPIGVFWSMRFPNKEERELALLAKYDLLPQGLNNIKVFIPLGLKNEVPKSTYDATFAIQPSLLTTDDWCLTFGIERFSPTGLLLEKAILKVKNGYKNKDGDVIKAKADRFSLEDLIRTLETDDELNSAERGYKADSIRALSSRFDAAKGWGVFSENGTPLSELSRENQLTIIDTSFLEDNVYALVIGILARRILAARKISTRRAAAEKLKETDVDEALEMEIPPTWLFIDEAHTLIPSGNVKTPATNSLIEYVKQGRQPGCSLVFATQQPSAIDTKVLSQLDIIMSHKLIFDDDIKAVFKRTPTIIPAKYKASSFIKTLPIGTAVTGDRREETSRAFVMKIRPRMSQHEGREAETSEGTKELAPEKAKSLAVEMLYSKVEKEGILEISKIDNLLQILSARYKANIPLSETLDELEKRGLQINPQKKIVLIPGRDIEEEAQKEKAKLKEDGKKGIDVEEIEGIGTESKKSTEQLVKEGKLIPIKQLQKQIIESSDAENIEVLGQNPIELLSFSKHLNEENARKKFDKMRQKKFLGLLGEEEFIDSISLKHLPVYKIKYNVYDSQETFFVGEAFVDATNVEFLHYKRGEGLIESKGFKIGKDLDKSELEILKTLTEKTMPLDEIAKRLKKKPQELQPIIDTMVSKKLLEEHKGKETVYTAGKELDLPPEALHALLGSMKRVSVKEETALHLIREQIDKNQLNDLLKKIWGNVKLKEIELIYLPVFEAEFKKKNGERRTMRIEAVTGNRI